MNKYLVKWQERKKLVCLREHESQLSYMFRTPPPSPPPPPPPPPNESPPPDFCSAKRLERDLKRSREILPPTSTLSALVQKSERKKSTQLGMKSKPPWNRKERARNTKRLSMYTLYSVLKVYTEYFVLFILIVFFALDHVSVQFYSVDLSLRKRPNSYWWASYEPQHITNKVTSFERKKGRRWQP